MSELRWNPLLKDWTIVASDRQHRPQMPKDWCPFCSGSGNVPENYKVYKYDNDFPALSQIPKKPDDVGSNFYKTEESYGKCEVILYSSNHNAKLWELSDDHLRELVDLWCERFEEMSKDEKIKYIYIFENRGKEVGVTMPHPHGQIYGYSKMPLKIKTELKSCREYYEENNECLICKMNKEERNFKERIITENDSFIAYIPFFTDYPFGVFIVSKEHIANITQFTEKQKNDFADITKNIVGSFDCIYDKEFPYMMCVHQTPVNTTEYGDYNEYYHFHVEFYPPLRDKNKIKYYASSEMGAGAACNPCSVEEEADILRKAYLKFIKKENKK